MDINDTTTLRYTNEERLKALNVSLTSLASELGYTPVRAGQHYILKEMDSLVIYNDRSWNRWSGRGNITGGSQIDFMLEFGGVATVPEAIHALLKFNGERVVSMDHIERKSSSRQNDFVLPPKNSDYRRLFAYLIKTRGLSQKVVHEFVHQNLIYEDAVHHNIVFCGRDPAGEIRYAGMRGTADIYGKSFKMDVPGNDKNYGVNIVNENSSVVKVFESVIDCMSYIDMTGDVVSNKLILGMVEDNPLAQFIKDYSHIKEINLCLDNDTAGKKAIYGNPDNRVRQPGLKEKYESMGFKVNVEVPPMGKDWNESLLLEKKRSETARNGEQDRNQQNEVKRNVRRRGR